MCKSALWVTIALVVFLTPAFAGENTPDIVASGDALTSIAIGGVTYTLPFAFPSAEDVLRALPKTKARPKNPRIQCDLLVYQLDPERWFPLIGPARLAHCHFKCTVESGQDRQVVYMDRDHLVLPKSK